MPLFCCLIHSCDEICFVKGLVNILGSVREEVHRLGT